MLTHIHAQPTLSNPGLRLLRLAWVLALVLSLTVGLAQHTLAASPPPVQTFYVPLPEDQVLQALGSIYPGRVACGSTAAEAVDPVNTYISISIISRNTVIYYDHWEDGFEIDVSAPTQPSTEIWGDGDPANGSPPGLAADLLSPDTVIVLDNLVNSTTRQNVVDFDGGDRVSATKLVAMTRAAWATGPNTLMAGALEVYDTGKWGTVYQAPVGEDVDADQIFEYAGLAIMAAGDDTTIYVDLDADGTADESATLDQGQSYPVNGGVLAGTVVTASAPIQVSLITGDRCDTYESRWYVLFPSDRWSASYYTPVGTPAGDGTRIFLFNPGVDDLTVSWETTGGAQPDVTVPAGGTAGQQVPAGSGARFFAANDAPFQAIAAVDADAGPGSNSQADWGFTLVPEQQLTAQVLVGWGPGRDPRSSVSPTENGSPVWVMPVVRNGTTGPIHICADYDGDDQGPLIDAFGFRYDERLSLNQFQIAKIFENGPGYDRDQTGMVLYVCDPDPATPSDARIAAAWGQDPSTASAGPPGLDLGTTAPPASAFTAGKGATVAVDADGDGLASPGDTIQYTVLVNNASRVPVETATVSDTIPAHTAYVADTTRFDDGAVTTPVADNQTGTPFPLDEGGILLRDLGVRSTFTVTFQVLVDNPFPAGVDRIRNVAVVASSGVTETPTVETPIDLDPSLLLEKATLDVDADSPPGPLIRAGTPVTWSYRISNTGIVPLANVVVTDSVSGVSPAYVSGDDGNDILDIGESWTLQATGTAVAGQYANVGRASGVAADGDVAVDTDPSHYFGVASGLALEKEADRTVLVTGDRVTYTLSVSNTGNVALSAPAVSDNQCNPVLPVPQTGTNSGDTDQDELLDPAEIWRFTCTTALNATTVNTATAATTDPLGESLSAMDSATVTAINPTLAISKTAAPLQLLSGATVIYTYRVTNPGDVPLADVTVTDDLCAPVTYVNGDSNADDALDLGETWIYRCDRAVEQDEVNTATATATDPLGNSLNAVDTAQVDVINPAIAVAKRPSRTTVGAGTLVTYTFTVTNAGDVPLNNVSLVDDHCSSLVFLEGDDGNNLLDLTETWRYRCAATIQEETTNTVMATAQDPLGNAVSDQDSATVSVPILYLPLALNPTPPKLCPPPDGCPVDGLERAKGLAVHEGLNRLYITSRDNDRLLVVDPYAMETLAQVPTGDEPWDIVVDEKQGRIYVSSFADGEVWVYNVETLAELARIPVGGEPALMAILPELETVFVVTRANGRVSVIQGLTKVGDLDSGGAGAYGIAANSQENVLFVANRDSGHLAAFVREGNEWVLRRGPLLNDGRSLFDLAYNPANNKLYLTYAAADESWFVDVWKPDLGNLWGPLRTGIPVDSGGGVDSPDVGGSGIGVNPVTGTLFNVNTAAATLTVIHGTDNGIRATIGLGPDPFAIAINSQTDTVFIGLRAPGRIVKIQDTYQ